MKAWPFIRRFPKLAIVAGIWIGSAVIFGIWWWTRGKPEHAPIAAATHAPVPAAEPDHRADTLPDRMARLILADGDLYDAGNGELIYKDWLHGDRPEELFYEPDKKRVVGKFEGGLIRYKLDGTREAELKSQFGVAVSKDRRSAVFPRAHDMWIADVDWDGFKLVNERQVTKLGTLNDAFMLQSVILNGGDVVVLRQGNQLLRVNLATGETAPGKLPIGDLKHGRSPNGAILMGDMSDRGGRKVFAYDVGKDEPVFENVGRKGVNDYAWINPERCLVLVGGDTVLSFDRKAKSFSELCKLALPAQKLFGPSTDGSYVFAGSNRAAQLIETGTGKVEIFQPAGENFDWVSPDTMLVCNTTPSSAARGTWIHKMGKEPERLISEPYQMSRDGVSALVVIPDAGWVVFATKDRLLRIDISGINLKELTSLAGEPKDLTRIKGVNQQ